jgi:hypothetical protein
MIHRVTRTEITAHTSGPAPSSQTGGAHSNPRALPFTAPSLHQPLATSHSSRAVLLLRRSSSVVSPPPPGIQPGGWIT